MDILRESVAKKVAWISLVSNVILTIGKIIIGIYSESDAVFADGIHSAADVFASVIVLLVISFANKPADKEHPYGHGKAEVIISGMVGVILFAVAVYIVIEGIIGLFHPIAPPNIIAMWVALLSYVSKVVLYRYSLNKGKTHNSKAIIAIAYDHKGDIIASLAAALGVLLSVVANRLDVSWLQYADKVASIFVAYLIFKISKDMLVESFDILLERNIEPDLMKEYIEIISSFPEVKRIDKIRAREHGHYILVDLRISIDHNKTIKEGHDLGRDIKLKLMENYDDIEEVLIHLNPYFTK